MNGSIQTPRANKSPVGPATRVSIPGHVVYRELPRQTVVLNLHTGRYHGLNPMSGRMLSALHAGLSIAAAARAVAERYGQPRAEVEHALCELCGRLLQRGIVRIAGDPRGAR